MTTRKYAFVVEFEAEHDYLIPEMDEAHEYVRDAVRSMKGCMRTDDSVQGIKSESVQVTPVELSVGWVKKA